MDKYRELYYFIQNKQSLKFTMVAFWMSFIVPLTVWLAGEPLIKIFIGTIFALMIWNIVFMNEINAMKYFLLSKTYLQIHEDDIPYFQLGDIVDLSAGSRKEQFRIIYIYDNILFIDEKKV